MLNVECRMSNLTHVYIIDFSSAAVGLLRKLMVMPSFCTFYIRHEKNLKFWNKCFDISEHFFITLYYYS